MRRRCKLLVGAMMLQRCLGSWWHGLDSLLYISRSSLEVPISFRHDFMSTRVHIQNGHQVRTPRRTVPLALWPWSGHIMAPLFSALGGKQGMRAATRMTLARALQLVSTSLRPWAAGTTLPGCV